MDVRDVARQFRSMAALALALCIGAIVVFAPF
jgi:hypothetical protein